MSVATKKCTGGPAKAHTVDRGGKSTPVPAPCMQTFHSRCTTMLASLTCCFCRAAYLPWELGIDTAGDGLKMMIAELSAPNSIAT
jgi:hypothetical protein